MASKYSSFLVAGSLLLAPQAVSGQSPAPSAQQRTAPQSPLRHAHYQDVPARGWTSDYDILVIGGKATTFAVTMTNKDKGLNVEAKGRVSGDQPSQASIIRVTNNGATLTLHAGEQVDPQAPNAAELQGALDSIGSTTQAAILAATGRGQGPAPGGAFQVQPNNAGAGPAVPTPAQSLGNAYTVHRDNLQGPGWSSDYTVGTAANGQLMMVEDSQFAGDPRTGQGRGLAIHSESPIVNGRVMPATTIIMTEPGQSPAVYTDPRQDLRTFRRVQENAQAVFQDMQLTGTPAPNDPPLPPGGRAIAFHAEDPRANRRSSDYTIQLDAGGAPVRIIENSVFRGNERTGEGRGTTIHSVSDISRNGHVELPGVIITADPGQPPHTYTDPRQDLRLFQLVRQNAQYALDDALRPPTPAPGGTSYGAPGGVPPHPVHAVPPVPEGGRAVDVSRNVRQSYESKFTVQLDKAGKPVRVIEESEGTGRQKGIHIHAESNVVNGQVQMPSYIRMTEPGKPDVESSDPRSSLQFFQATRQAGQIVLQNLPKPQAPKL